MNNQCSADKKPAAFDSCVKSGKARDNVSNSTSTGRNDAGISGDGSVITWCRCRDAISEVLTKYSWPLAIVALCVLLLELLLAMGAFHLLCTWTRYLYVRYSLYVCVCLAFFSCVSVSSLTMYTHIKIGIRRQNRKG